MKSKFDDLYKVIMEGKYAPGSDKFDVADVRHQKLAYGQDEVGAGVRLIGMMNSQPVLDPDGNPLEWQVNATDFKSVDCVTGQPLPKYTSTFWLKNGLNRGKGLHVAVATYEDVYYNQDSPIYQNPEYMQKLHDLGLIPGFKLSY